MEQLANNTSIAQRLVADIKSGSRLFHVCTKYHISSDNAYKILADNNINYQELLEQRRQKSESPFCKRRYQSPPKEKLISEFRRISAKLERAPSWEELKRFSKINCRHFRLAFGTIANAIKEAAIANRAHQIEDREILKHQLIAHLKQKTLQLGYIPARKDILNDSTHPYIKYRYAFGNLKKAVEHAGLKDDERLKEKIRLELTSSLKQKAQSLGRIPSKTEILSDRIQSLRYRFAFGSYKKTIEVSGLKDDPQFKEKVKQELIKHLNQKTILLGRAPLKIEMMKDKTCNYMRYYTYFGGLRNALKAAGISANVNSFSYISHSSSVVPDSISAPSKGS